MRTALIDKNDLDGWLLCFSRHNSHPGFQGFGIEILVVMAILVNYTFLVDRNLNVTSNLQPLIADRYQWLPVPN